MKLDVLVPGGPCRVEPWTGDLAAAQRFHAELFGRRCETDPRQEAGGYTVAHLGDAPVAALGPLYQEAHHGRLPGIGQGRPGEGEPGSVAPSGATPEWRGVRR